MDHVFYGASGEGRGHATRVRTVIEHLKRNCRVTLFTYGDAHDLLAPLYRYDPSVDVHEVPGIRFAYGQDRRLSYLKTAAAALPVVARFPRALSRIRRLMKDRRPRFAINDFEPLVSSAARLRGVPVVNLDHQSFLTHFDLGGLPGPLRRRANFLRPFVEAVGTRPSRAIVSAFYDCPLRERAWRADRVGVLLGPEVSAAEPTVAPHLIAYLRRDVDAGVLEALTRCPRPVMIYGLGERPSHLNLEFKATSISGFIRDLASSTALVSTAGNQLVGEAFHLRKPVIAIPEPGNFEQQLNGHFVAASGGGLCVEATEFSGELLRDFLLRVEQYREAIDPESAVGNRRCFDLLDEMLGGPRQEAPAPRVQPV